MSVITQSNHLNPARILRNPFIPRDLTSNWLRSGFFPLAPKLASFLQNPSPTGPLGCDSIHANWKVHMLRLRRLHLQSIAVLLLSATLAISQETRGGIFG